jgi:dihydrofolate reductase
MKPIMIAAVARNGVIGCNGKIPWLGDERYADFRKDDLGRFRLLTLGHPVIMGRKTGESLGGPLAGRPNIVATSSPIVIPGMVRVSSLEDALHICENEYHGIVPYIIGGASIFHQAMPLCDAIELTRIEKDFEGDTYCPDIDWRRWQEISSWNKRCKEFDYSFKTYFARY